MSLRRQSSPLALDDDQLSTIMQHTQPLAPSDRDSFVKAVAAELSSVNVIGPGMIARACATLQGQFIGRAVGSGRLPMSSKYTHGPDWIHRPSKAKGRSVKGERKSPRPG